MENHSNINNEFIPYKYALKLKELGFNERCLAHYWEYLDSSEILFETESEEEYSTSPRKWNTECKAPLWQQAFDFFRNKGLWSWIEDDQELDDDDDFWRYIIKDWSAESYEKAFTFGQTEIQYEDARLKCLEKLIEIYDTQRNIKTSSGNKGL